MRLLDRLERKFRPYAVPNLTLVIIIGQVIGFIQCSRDAQNLASFLLIPQNVLAGEAWRLITFMFFQVYLNLLKFIIAMMFFYFAGNVLERSWGVFRYNVYLLSGYLITVACAFVYPMAIATNEFIFSSVFLAFAWQYPEFVIRIYYIIPVKAKWLAAFIWCVNGYYFFKGPNALRLMVLAGVANFFLLFGAEVIRRLRSKSRKVQARAQASADAKKPKHECVVCGVTDKTDPTIEFRYCSKCEGALCYCENHLRDHAHVGNVDA